MSGPSDSNVTSINPVAELEQFFTEIYKDEIGYAYSPTKDNKTGEWCTHFFQWPGQKEELVQHVISNTETLEVYYGPALLKKPEATKEGFLGSHYVWAEFDGATPSNEILATIPEPSIRIQSSTSQHEHWYWQLEYFETDQKSLELLTKKLAYALQGDLGTWNCNRVLRPPTTVHHESGNRTVILAKSVNISAIEDFARLPSPPKDSLSYSEVDLDRVPQVIDVIAKYPWPEDEFDLFKKTRPSNNDRNVAMARLGFVCAELGMSNEEMLSILLNVDERWKKFYKRPDRVHRLVSIINYVRDKKQEQQEQSATEINQFQVYGFMDLLATSVNISWAVEGLVHDRGSVLVTSAPGVGKTQFCIRFGMHCAIGMDFLHWTITEPRKILFLSLEMDLIEIKFLLEQMAQGLTEEEKILLNENFEILPYGSGVALTKAENQKNLCALIDRHKPAGLIIDSLGVSIEGQISDNEVVNKLYRFINSEIRRNRNCFVWFIHHDRKAQIGNKKPNELSDVYGSQFLGAHPRTIIHLWGTEDGTIEVKCLKLSLAPKFKDFIISRGPSLNFQIVEKEEVGHMNRMSKDVEREPSNESTTFDL